MTASRLHALHAGGDVGDWAMFDPFDARVGTKVYTPYFVYVIEHPSGTVLFDSGAHPALGVDPRGRLGEAANYLDLRLGPEHDLRRLLARIGKRPQDIDLVVQSHLHFDHCGGLRCLGHAPILVQREELAFAYDPPVYQRASYVRDDFDQGLTWEAVGSVHDVFGDGSLVIHATPGHTPGHQSLLVRLPGQTIFLLADATYLVDKMRARLLPAVVWSPDALIATWERVEEIERRTGALLLATHELDFRQSVRLAPAQHYA